MGFLDSIGESINRGAESVGRGTKSAQLKMRLNELVKERQKLAAQLGAGLYDKVKDNPAIREGLEPLFDGIAAIDSQRADIQAEIDSIEAAGVASAAAAVTYKCPGCGSTVGAGDLFCSGCGKPIAEVKAAAEAAASAAAVPVAPAGVSGLACPSCGAPITADDAFCMNCGSPVSQAVSSTPSIVDDAVLVGEAIIASAEESADVDSVFNKDSN